MTLLHQKSLFSLRNDFLTILTVLFSCKFLDLLEMTIRKAKQRLPGVGVIELRGAARSNFWCSAGILPSTRIGKREEQTTHLPVTKLQDTRTLLPSYLIICDRQRPSTASRIRSQGARKGPALISNPGTCEIYLKST